MRSWARLWARPWGARTGHQASTGVALVPSSFHGRFMAGTVRLLPRALVRAAEPLGHPSGNLRGHLARFKDLLVAHATVLRLHDALARAFPGCRDEGPALRRRCPQRRSGCWGDVGEATASDAKDSRRDAWLRSHTGRFGWYLAGGTLPLLIAFTPVVIVIHELGHVLAGALLGFRFQFVQVGRVQVVRTLHGVRLRWNQPLPDDILGLQSSIPDGDEVSISRLVAHAAGGPVLNLATAALALGVAAVTPVRSATAEALLAVVRLVGVFSGLAIVNLLPFRTPRGRLSDGALILHYLRVGAPSLSAFMRVMRRSAVGQRPREWGIDARALATWAGVPAPTGPWLLLFALGVALDQGDQTLARELLARAESVQEPTARLELTRLAALVDALQGDALHARERLEGLGKPPWDSGYSALAEAALLVAEARGQEAREALDRWDRFVAASPPGVRVGNEWAEEAVRARLDTALAVASEQTGS